MKRQIEIRPATESDIPAIANVLVDTWRSTFRGLLPSDFLDGMSHAHQSERHLRMFRKPEAIYHVATDLQGHIVGFASGGPTRHPDFPYQNELYAIYVLDSHQGSGVGTTLFRTLAGDLHRSGRTGLIVWVLINNPNRGFYERHGGTLIGRQPITLGSATIEEFAYGWDDVLPARSRS